MQEYIFSLHTFRHLLDWIQNPICFCCNRFFSRQNLK